MSLEIGGRLIWTSMGGRLSSELIPQARGRLCRKGPPGQQGAGEGASG